MRATGVLGPALFARLYGMCGEPCAVHARIRPAMRSRRRSRAWIASGDVGDTDIYGAQQHAPLLDVEIPLPADAIPPEGVIAMTAADRSLCFLTIEEAARLISLRELSPLELVRAFLARIEAVDGALATYITVCTDDALASARRAEAEIMRGSYRGSLHGIPYGLKDNFMVRGVRATANSHLMKDHIATENATAHRRLQDAGAILLGKLGTYEYGTGDGDDLFELPFAPTRNPWDPHCFPGGSTIGGGASVAAGTAMLALGTDTTGSVRLPAAACGAAGLKPTYGLVSRAGVMPNCYSLDCVGPIAWTARDTGIALRAIAGLRSRRPGER